MTNPNASVLAFRSVTVGLDLNGMPLAEAVSENPVRLLPQSSTDVPFAVTTTARNLGPQFLALLQTGAMDYRVHGTVQLDGALRLTLPFSRSGRLDFLTAGQGVLTDASKPGTQCDVAVPPPVAAPAF